MIRYARKALELTLELIQELQHGGIGVIAAFIPVKDAERVQVPYAAHGSGTIRFITEQELVSIYKSIRDIPYSIPLVVEEEDRCCTGKHQKLQELLEKRGYKVRWRTAPFKWSSFNLPEEVKKVPHDDDSMHAFLEVNLNGEWVVLDASWDERLSDVLPVNEWDGKSNTQIAVPSIKVHSPEESIEVMRRESETEFIREDLEMNGAFYKAVNVWLGQVRQGKF